MRKTLWSFEVPIRHIEEFDDLQDYYFTLSFLYDNPMYYKSMQTTTKQLWIDNSFNELREAEGYDKLTNLYRTTKATKVLAPDHPDWGQEKMLDQFKAMCEAGVPARSVISIIHHPDWIGYYKSYGVKHFAVPYDFRYCTLNKLRRFSDCHFLGLVSVDEILEARPPSCDTAMPVKLALLDCTIGSWIIQGCPHIHTVPGFFDLKLTKRQLAAARKNINELRRICDEKE